MKNVFISTIVFTFLITGCNNKKKIPDTSAIKINLELQRFERDLFGVDTNHIDNGLQVLHAKYPFFLQDYLMQVLSCDPVPDSIVKNVHQFIVAYKFASDSVQKKLIDLSANKKEIESSFKFIRYYFPNYKLPTKIITFVGPFEGTANALTNDAIAIGLQAYLGKDFPAYHTLYLSQVYPSYKTKRFEPEYMAVNCIKNILEDMFPDKSVGQQLSNRIIESGKRLYLLDALMPYTPDTLKTGYSEQQLAECNNNEKNIWAFFVQSGMLTEVEPGKIASYVTDGPNTPELSQAAPGNIGQFTGWKIVTAWMNNHPKVSLLQLMQTPAHIIFEEAKYKP